MEFDSVSKVLHLYTSNEVSSYSCVNGTFIQKLKFPINLCSLYCCGGTKLLVLFCESNCFIFDSSSCSLCEIKMTDRPTCFYYALQSSFFLLGTNSGRLVFVNLDLEFKKSYLEPKISFTITVKPLDSFVGSLNLISGDPESPNRVAVCTKTRLVLYDLEKKEKLWELDFKQIQSVHWHPLGACFAVCSIDAIYFYNADSQKLVFEQPNSLVLDAWLGAPHDQDSILCLRAMDSMEFVMIPPSSSLMKSLKLGFSQKQVGNSCLFNASSIVEFPAPEPGLGELKKFIPLSFCPWTKKTCLFLFCYQKCFFYESCCSCSLDKKKNELIDKLYVPSICGFMWGKIKNIIHVVEPKLIAVTEELDKEVKMKNISNFSFQKTLGEEKLIYVISSSGNITAVRYINHVMERSNALSINLEPIKLLLINVLPSSAALRSDFAEWYTNLYPIHISAKGTLLTVTYANKVVIIFTLRENIVASPENDKIFISPVDAAFNLKRVLDIGPLCCLSLTMDKSIYDLYSESAFLPLKVLISRNIMYDCNNGEDPEAVSTFDSNAVIATKNKIICFNLNAEASLFEYKLQCNPVFISALGNEIVVVSKCVFKINMENSQMNSFELDSDFINLYHHDDKHIVITSKKISVLNSNLTCLTSVKKEISNCHFENDVLSVSSKDCVFCLSVPELKTLQKHKIDQHEMAFATSSGAILVNNNQIQYHSFTIPAPTNSEVQCNLPPKPKSLRAPVSEPKLWNVFDRKSSTTGDYGAKLNSLESAVKGLNERQEKLENLNEKFSDLAVASKSFADMAAKMNKK